MRLLSLSATCLVVTACLALCACTTLPDADDVPASNQMAPGMAPTPFSAAQIREGCPDGRTIRFELRKGSNVKINHEMVFSDGDAEGVTVSGSRALWTDLQSHASFATGTVEIGLSNCSTPAGDFDCWLYTITEPQGDHTMVREMYFARNLPGPPVQLIVSVDGKTVQSMTMLQTQ